MVTESTTDTNSRDATDDTERRPQSGTYKKLEDRLRVFELELSSQLALRIKDAIEEHDQRLSSYWAFGTRIIGGATAVVVAALGFVGWSSWTGITARIDAAVNARLDEKLRDSPPAQYERDVQRLYDQAVVSAYLANVPRDSESSWYAPGNLEPISNDDFRRFLDLLLSPETEYATSEKIVRIMAYYRDSGGIPNISTLGLRQALTKEPPAAWLQNSPDRWAQLVRVAMIFRDSGVTTRVRTLVNRQNTPNEVRLAALGYIREMFVMDADVEVQEVIEREGDSGELGIASISTLAVIAPESEPIKSRISSIRETPRLSQRDLYLYLAMAANLAKLGLSDHVDSFDEVKERESLAKDILQSLVQYEFYLERSGDDVRLTSESRSLDGVTVPLDLVRSYEIEQAVGEALADFSRRGDVVSFSGLIRRFSVRDDIGRGWNLAPNIDHYSGSLGLVDGRSVSLDQTEGGAILVPAEDGTVSVFWTDLAGRGRHGALSAIDGLRVRSGIRLVSVPDWVKDFSVPDARQETARPGT